MIEFLIVQRVHPHVLPHIGSDFKISKQNLSACPAVTCRLMVGKVYTVIIAEHIQLMTHSGNDAPSHLHGT